MIRVLIADNHEVVRIGIRCILETNEHIKVIGEAGTGKETIELCQKLKPNVVSLALDMPNMDGLTVIPHIRSLRLNIKILVFTIFDDLNYVRQAMKDGASGFLLKRSNAHDLITAVKKVAHDEIVVEPSLKEQIALEVYGKAKQTSKNLCSPRETQIISRIVRGIKMTDIAKELSISPSTVATHKERIMKKFGLKTTADLIRFANENGLNLFEKKLNFSK